MTTKNLTETSRATQVEAIAKNSGYEYQVSYSFSDKNLTRLQCNINKVTKADTVEQRIYSGYMSLDNGNKSMNFPADIEITPHITMFDNIVKEVKESLSAE